MTANLETALRHIRDQKRALRVWADAICINQVEEAEKNRQVQHIRSIYSAAHYTVIYLGASNNETDIFFDALHSLSKRLSPFTMDIELENNLNYTLDNILEYNILTRL